MTEPTITVHLPREAAYRLLDERGFRTVAVGPGMQWVAPDGSRYWETDEALTVALSADAMAGA